MGNIQVDCADIEQGIRFREAAPPTREYMAKNDERLKEGDKRFNSIDMHLNDMKNDIDKIKLSIDNFHITNKEEHSQIMIALKDLKDNSASKLTEKIVYGAVMIILIAVFSAVIYLVIKR